MDLIKFGLATATVLAFIGTAQPSLAKTFTATISSEAKPLFFRGQLQGCALNFEVGRNDPEYSEGELAYITGSLNYYTNENKGPSFALKLGVKNGVEAEGFVAPADAFLISGFTSNKSDFLTAFDSETPGFRVFAFNAGEPTLQAVASEVGETGTLTFAYALRTGGMNAIVPVDLTIKELNFDSPENSIFDKSTPLAWIECLQEATQASASREHAVNP